MKLIVQAGALLGDIFEVTKDDVTIGRGSNNDIVISDPAISRTHCQIRREGGGYTIQDANSANGTYINDERIALPYILRDGDEIRLGETTLRVEDANTVAVMGEEVAPVTTAGATRNRGRVLAGLAVLAAIVLLIAAVMMNRSAPAQVGSPFTPTRALTVPPAGTSTPAATAVAINTTAPATLPLETATSISIPTVETILATPTISPTPVPGRVYPIPIPTLLVPVSGAKFTSADPIQFGWSGGDLGPNEVYRIQVSTNNEFSKMACEIRTRDNLATIPGDAAVCTDLWQYGKQYFWRAQIVQRDAVSSDAGGTAYTGPIGEFSWAP